MYAVRRSSLPMRFLAVFAKFSLPSDSDTFDVLLFAITQQP
jgi:hypothetical protein